MVILFNGAEGTIASGNTAVAAFRNYKGSNTDNNENDKPTSDTPDTPSMRPVPVTRQIRFCG